MTLLGLLADSSGRLCTHISRTSSQCSHTQAVGRFARDGVAVLLANRLRRLSCLAIPVMALLGYFIVQSL